MTVHSMETGKSFFCFIFWLSCLVQYLLVLPSLSSWVWFSLPVFGAGASSICHAFADIAWWWMEKLIALVSPAIGDPSSECQTADCLHEQSHEIEAQILTEQQPLRIAKPFVEGWVIQQHHWYRKVYSPWWWRCQGSVFKTSINSPRSSVYLISAPECWNKCTSVPHG